jgi:hypothetical protein
MKPETLRKTREGDRDDSSGTGICVLAGLLNGGASRTLRCDRLTPEESFSIGFTSRVLRNQKTGAGGGLIDVCCGSQALGDG